MPTATARTTNRNLNEEERASRQAIFNAVDQEKRICFFSLRSHNYAVAQDDPASGAAGQRRVVRHQDQRGSFALVERDQQIENMLAVLAVEIAGGLVGQQNGRPHHEGASQSDALLLAAGKLHRVVIGAVEQADAVEQLACALAAVRALMPPVSSNGSSTFSSAVSVGSR